MSSVSVVVPAHNEEEGIRTVLLALQRIPVVREIIVVDDGSTDATAVSAEAMGARVLRHPCRAGYGRSLKDGIAAATSDVIAIVDADGTYPVDVLPDLLARMEEGYDMVVGARTGPVYRGGVVKASSRAVFRLLSEFVAGRRIPDINSGMRLFRRRDVLPLLPHLCEGFSFTTTLTLIMMLTHKFIAYVPMPYAERRGRSKVRIVKDSLQTLQYLVEVITVYNPLKLFLLLTLGLLTLSAGLLGIGLLQDSALILLSSLLTFLSSVLVFAVGLLAHLRSRQRTKQEWKLSCRGSMDAPSSVSGEPTVHEQVVHRVHGR